MIKKFKKVLNLTLREKKLLLHAYFLLGIFRASVLTISFKRLSKSFQHQSKLAHHKPIDKNQLKKAKAIGWAVETAARYTPWNSNCLAQALTAQRLLKQQGIAGMFFLGVRKDKQNIEAHAWLQCNSHILTGKAGHETYVIISKFSWH